ncbi:MAG: EAL domain-containing protein, partial [Sphingomonadaceae bacterium]|nr:EAL domain-containing protein [Sphingomonadaceae bacterium]
ARLGNINTWANAFGLVWKLPYSGRVSGSVYPSYASILSGRRGGEEQLFTIDYLIDLKTIPAFSAADILSGAKTASRLRGKDVLIGVGTDQIGDVHRMPGYGLAAGVYLHALGGETLAKGRPIEAGWFLPLCGAFLLVALHLFVARRALARTALVSGFILCLAGSAILESWQVYLTSVPALLLLSVAGVSSAWMRFKRRGATINALSGLPNLNALRLKESRPGIALVVARIKNYAEIVAIFPADTERALVGQIVNRFELGIDGTTLYQGDDGTFAWFAAQRPGIALGDQLEGLHAVFTTPIVVADRQVDLSIGFGVDQDATRTVVSRLGSATISAGEAVDEARKWKLYDPSKLHDSEWRLSLLGRLDMAIDSGEIWVAYQPKLDLTTNRIVGAEALVRWSHPEKGDIAPMDFILAAEQHNRIEKLTLHVLDEAVRAAAAINAHGIDFNIAVNLSARLLERSDLANTISARLSRHGLQPERLTLEVTESAAMGGSGGSMRMLEQLGSLGIAISIDDYGTGFSTLEYLRDIPATEIKIDRSFVAAMERSHSDRLMVHSTIQLAHSLGRQVVAEGVERLETLELLRQMRCDKAQGYLIGRPMKFVALSRTILGERKEIAA